MSRWLKSIRRNFEASQRKLNKVFTRVNKLDEYLVVTHGGHTQLAGPFKTILEAEQYIEQHFLRQ